MLDRNQLDYSNLNTTEILMKDQEVEYINTIIEDLLNFCSDCSKEEARMIWIEIVRIHNCIHEKIFNTNKFLPLTPEQVKSSMEFRKRAIERD